MTKAPLLALYSDFGSDGPYCGQVFAKWAEHAPDIPAINLFANSPAFDIEAGAHLLFAYTRQLPSGSVIEAVVDPGVGGSREACVIQADDYWFVGPSNGLFDVIMGRSKVCHAWHVDWRPVSLSNTFHGRDLFAPIAADIANNGKLTKAANPISPKDIMHNDIVSDPSERIVFIDVYGNLVTGISSGQIHPSQKITINNNALSFAPRFDAVPKGHAFWYVNSNGLVEIAANQTSACELFASQVGQVIFCS